MYLLKCFYIPFLETCPDVNDLDDWMIWKDNSEIYCGEGACQPCNPGKRNS